MYNLIFELLLFHLFRFQISDSLRFFQKYTIFFSSVLLNETSQIEMKRYKYKKANKPSPKNFIVNFIIFISLLTLLTWLSQKAAKKDIPTFPSKGNITFAFLQDFCNFSEIYLLIYFVFLENDSLK